VLKVPLKTLSPIFLVLVKASPVSDDSSIWASPSITFPSAGTKSPGRTTSESPTCISDTLISSMLAPFVLWAILGDLASRASREDEARLPLSF